ncbi:MAG: RDD family protein [Bacteroidetes bacterium]|nr:RDD family protein [Bacteroidota bacterium]
MAIKKITELTEERWRTVYLKDEYGNRHATTEDYTAYREVKTIAPGPRFAHYLADTFCFYFLLAIIQIPMEALAALLSGQSAIASAFDVFTSLSVFALYPIYYAVSEHLWHRTPGKFLTDSYVIDEYGNKPSLRVTLLRTVCRLVPFEPFSCLGDPSRGWHDSWSNTWVVTKEEMIELKRLQLEQSEDFRASDL